MPETLTGKLAEDVDAAIRDAYHALRTALHKVEDLKMKMIRQPDVKPFGPEHEEMYKMYLDLSKRFQETREEIRDRSPTVQPQPPTPGPAPCTTGESRSGKSPFQRSKSRPYVLVPPRTLVFNALAPPVKGRIDRLKEALAATSSEPLKCKRKAAEPKEDESSCSESERAIEDYLSPKRVKTRHSCPEVNDEVQVIEDSERDSSPLTELSSSSPMPSMAPALPSLGVQEASHASRYSPPTPSSHPSGVPPTPVGQEAVKPVSSPTPGPSRHQGRELEPDLEEQQSEHDTPHTVLEPLPALDLELAPALTRSLATSKRRGDDTKSPAKGDKKPKSKGKKKGGPESQFNMEDALRDRRLSAVGPDFEVDNDRITHHRAGPNSRATMSQIFGGNPQRMISYPSPKKRRAHGFTHALLFPSKKFNPLLPTKIGERGLLFRLDQKLEQWVDNEGGVGPYHLMMHHTSDDYCYFGVYEFVRVDPVTKGEWRVQSSQVKDNWVNHALGTNTGEQTRARVFLRRELGREPTKAEVDATKKDKSLKSRLTVAQIMEDFNSGTEQLVIWGMKCIGYNYEFEKHLADNL